MRPPQRGVTLIELIIAVALTAIVVSFGVSFIATPVQTLETSGQRELLANDAALASAAIGRDLRAALPGSIRARRVGSLLAVELLRVIDTSSALPDSLATGAAQTLQLGAPDNSFETLGSFPGTALPLDSRQLYLAMHDPHSLISPYTGTGTISIAGTRIRITAGSVVGQSLIQLTPAANFAGIGLQRRLYLVSGPVTWLCEPATGQLRRFAGYTMAANQSQRDSAAKLLAAGAQVALTATNLSTCQFSLQTLAAARQTSATLTVQIMRGTETLNASTTVVIDDAG
jgi:MSHA biogenesis protein MshO